MYIVWDEDRQEYGYWLNEDRTWIPCDKSSEGGY